MNYYIGDAGRQRGPFTIEQLRAMNLRSDTLVWREGMSQWQPAHSIPELQLIAAGPAPTPYPSAPPYNPPESKRILAGLMAIFFGAFGVHKFVLGFTGAGMVYLLVTLLTCFFAYPIMHILAVVEGIVYLCKSDEQFYRDYVVERRAWF
jgi:TM2 domain-containing membrane protein YozV